MAFVLSCRRSFSGHPKSERSRSQTRRSAFLGGPGENGARKRANRAGLRSRRGEPRKQNEGACRARLGVSRQAKRCPRKPALKGDRYRKATCSNEIRRASSAPPRARLTSVDTAAAAIADPCRRRLDLASDESF